MAETKGSAKKGTSEQGREGSQVCPVAVCPVGMFLTVAGQARPEVVEHLLAAGRELVLAATAFMNARAEAVRDAPRLEKIEID